MHACTAAEAMWLPASLLLLARVNFRDWRMGPKGRDGACMSAGGNTGSYDKVWATSETACAASCMESLSCFAYEFAVLRRGYTTCGNDRSSLAFSVSFLPAPTSATAGHA